MDDGLLAGKAPTDFTEMLWTEANFPLPRSESVVRFLSCLLCGSRMLSYPRDHFSSNDFQWGLSGPCLKHILLQRTMIPNVLSHFTAKHKNILCMRISRRRGDFKHVSSSFFVVRRNFRHTHVSWVTKSQLQINDITNYNISFNYLRL